MGITKASQIREIKNYSLWARQIWYWEGAATLMQLAKYGTTKPQKCKFTVTVDEITICNVSEVIPCTEEAMKSIDFVAEWKE